jgi:hypothetical protein
MAPLTIAVHRIDLPEQEQFVRHLVADVDPLVLLTVMHHHVFAANISEDGVTCHELVNLVDCCGIAYGEGPVTERTFEWLPHAEGRYQQTKSRNKNDGNSMTDLR